MVPLLPGAIGRHLLKWTIRQPHRRFRPNIIAATPSGSGSSPVKLRRPPSRSTYEQWRCNTSCWPNVSITARIRPTFESCRSGECWAFPSCVNLTGSASCSTAYRASWTITNASCARASSEE